ncbi:DUF500 and UBA/TS-N domain-containing protein [Madurella fahalii]|uniref:DUF500 and UBA/TS-N domain-containing protein n=1 Tax=Madurella fahalii TaxID=1157608 RepID=A0ABQ0GKC8_9PEZI
MSSNEKQFPGNSGAQQGQQPYFPPPPPGPPPAQASQTQVPKHSNENPIPDYNIPTYNPAQPQFAPPSTAADDDIYNASPTDGHPPKFPDPHHHHHDEDASKKKSHRLSGLGHAFTNKVAGPVNALAQKFGSEGFMPESLDKECEKAARILRGFCKDGIYSDAVPPTAPAPTTAPATATGPSLTSTKPVVAEKPTIDASKAKKSRVLLTIPSKVIARAQGLAIFTAVRVGFQATGSSGSGILIARLPDGSWSPPSGIQITSIGAGFVAGLDIYDCVVVINTREALELFTSTRLSLGSDLAVTAGPFGAGGALDWGVPPSPGGGQRGRDKSKEKVTAEKQQQQQQAGLSTQPLSADNRRFQTHNVPEQEQLEPDQRPDLKERRPSPFREAIKKPVYSYVKSRGFYAGIQIDGTVVAEREGANAKFYGQAVPVAKILRGEVPAQGPQGMWPVGAKSLYDVLKGAEGGWRGQQQGQARPVSPSPVTPTFDPNVGAPPSTWVPGVTAGVQGLNIGSDSAAGPSKVHRGPPPPAGAVPPTAGASAKAAEAAAEAARAEAYAPPPPGYTEQHDPEDLPPAYVDDDNYRPPAPGDSKTGLH